MVEVDQLKQAAEAISPTSAGALSVPRLRLVRASATNIVDRFLAEGCSYALPVDAETRRVSAVEIRTRRRRRGRDRTRPGADHAMLEALEVPFRETELALAKALALLQKKHSHAGRVMTASKAKAGGEDGKTRVVVLGGGAGGAVLAFGLDNDPESRFHVTLVDPKNFFEDVTHQPMTMVNPEVRDDPGKLSKPPRRSPRRCPTASTSPGSSCPSPPITWRLGRSEPSCLSTTVSSPRDRVTHPTSRW